MAAICEIYFYSAILMDYICDSFKYLSSVSVSNVFFILFLNILIYLYLTSLVFFLLFLFDLRYFRTLNEFKVIYNNKFLSTAFVLALLSLAGVPPMLGFIGKLVMLLLFYSKFNLLIFFFFIIITIFSIYYYILNLRYLANEDSSIFYHMKGNIIYLNFPIVFLITVMFIFNVGALFFFQDILVFCFFF